MRMRLFPLILLVFFVACSTSSTSQTGAGGSSGSQSKTTPTSTAQIVLASEEEQRKTFASLKKVDDYPLYTMTYYGAYNAIPAPVAYSDIVEKYGSWGCSLFAAFGNQQHKVYGRNFDWPFSPVVLLFTNPADGYASVSMAHIGVLGFDENDVANLSKSAKRSLLMKAPLIPFDGMNEYGLTIGMAAVDDTQLPQDAQKPTAGGIRIIRLMLDYAKNVDEAIALLQKYNIDFTGGPNMHYMIADPSGRAATIELKDGMMHISRNEDPWQVTTNFYLTGSSDTVKAQDWRYQTAYSWLQSAQGKATPEQAMQLLSNVKQGHTQWSIVYDMSTGNVNVVMAQKYAQVHTFHLNMK